MDLNHVYFSMDCLRWDMFNKAKAPAIKNFTEYEKVYTRAGCTIPSHTAMFMNLPFYESKQCLVPGIKPWSWIPSYLQKQGYHTAIITPNNMFLLLNHIFRKGINDYEILKNANLYNAPKIVDKIIEIFESNNKPKFIYALFLETHQPYCYRKVTETVLEEPYRSVFNQVRALEKVNEEFERLKKKLDGTNTDLCFMSDHGDLDLKLEGVQGHGNHIFHPKLFEVPFGRKTI